MPEYFLRSSRLGFRKWSEDDLPLALGLWRDPAVTRFISRNGFSESDVHARLQREMESERTCRLAYWPIFLLDSGEHVGCCGLRPRAADPNVPELGVHIGSKHWRRGYAFEAASCVIRYAFDVLGYDALFAGHHPFNSASRNLLARLGFRHTHDELFEPTGLQHPSYRLERAMIRPSTGKERL